MAEYEEGWNYEEGQLGEEVPQGEEGMSLEELEGIVSGLIEDAEDYIDQTEAKDRVLANNYYQGLPFGNEEEGRSQVVSYDVRDTISLMLPQVMRTFFGPEKVVEYLPRSEEDVAHAKQATDYVNSVVLSQDNPAYLRFFGVFKDALLKRVGIVKVNWQTKTEVEHEEYSGLDDAALEAVLSSDGIEDAQVESAPLPEFEQAVGMGELPLEEVPKIHSVTLRRQTETGAVLVDALPPEEFLIDRRAKSVEEADIVAHRRYLSVSELVEMGYDFEEMLALAGDETGFGTNTEYMARHDQALFSGGESGGAANRTVLYTAAYVKVDWEGSGIASLRRVCCAGSHHEVLHHNPVNEAPFVVFTPYPEPHMWRGQSVADLTMDLQLVKSAVLRNMLDSLAKSIHPDTEAVVGQIVDMDDLLSNRVGKVVRTRAPGAVREMVKDFSGREAFPMLDYLDQIREDRTGMSKASMGLDPSALQSSTRAAVSATVAASQAQIELLCRTFAETGMKPLFKKILRILHSHQDRERMVRLRNEWVPVDPRRWDAGMDVSVNVALGMGSNEERFQSLSLLVAKQEQILKELGPENPLVNLQQYHTTLARMTELSGHKDVSAFWTDPATYQAPPPEEPKPTPDEIFAQAQADKVRADMMVDQEKLALDREKMVRDDDLARDKLETENLIKSRELESRYQTTIDQVHLKGMMDRSRDEMPPQGEA